MRRDDGREVVLQWRNRARLTGPALPPPWPAILRFLSLSPNFLHRGLSLMSHLRVGLLLLFLLSLLSLGQVFGRRVQPAALSLSVKWSDQRQGVMRGERPSVWAWKRRGAH